MAQSYNIAELGQEIVVDITSNTITLLSNLVAFGVTANNISVLGSITVGGSFGGPTNVLTSNGAGGMYWAPPIPSINAAASVAFTNTTPSGNAVTGALTLAGGLGVYGNVYTRGVVGYSNTSNVGVVYTYYNVATNSLDTVFG